MLTILNIAWPFFGLILLGVIAGRIWAKGEEGLAWLNIFVFYFALPALIFMVVAATPLEKLANPAYVTTTTAITTLSFFAMVLLGRFVFGNPLRVAALQGTSASYGNVGYMGLPLAVAFFGPEAAVPAALVFCFDCIVEFLYTAVLAGVDGGHRNRTSMLVAVLRDIATHPFIVATAFGIVASAIHWSPDGGLRTILEMLMRAAGPVALFAMGVTVALRGKPKLGADLPVLTIIKLVLQPALTYFAITYFVSADTVWLDVAVMMAALPTASNAFILARQYESYIEGAGAAVITTTVFSVITIPVIVYLLQP